MVGLGSTVPPPSSSLSGLPFDSSFPTPSTSCPLVSTPPGFSSSFAAHPVPSSSSYPGLALSVAYSPSFLPAAPSWFSSGSACSSFGSFSRFTPYQSCFCFFSHCCCFFFSVTSLLSPAPGSSSFLSPPSVPAPHPFPHTPVPATLYFTSAPTPSAYTFVTWSLLTVPLCSAPSLSYLTPQAPSFAPQVFSLGPSAPLRPPPSSSLIPSSSSLPFSLALPLSSFDSSGSASFPAPAWCAPVVPGTGVSSGVPPSASNASAHVLTGAAGSLDPEGAFLCHDFNDSSVKEEKGEAALGKAAFSPAFHEVVSLITGFVPRAKPASSSSSSEESIPWEDICGPSSGCDPRVFLLLFDKMSL